MSVLQVTGQEFQTPFRQVEECFWLSKLSRIWCGEEKAYLGPVTDTNVLDTNLDQLEEAGSPMLQMKRLRHEGWVTCHVVSGKYVYSFP